MTAELTASTISQSLATDIHEGVLAQGEMFPSERDLCERFGVGRGTVRNAMTNLQAMGLVDHAHGKRPRVAAPTLSRVMAGVSEAARFFFSGAEGKAHLEQARLFMETSMLRYAVDHATNAQVARMVEAIEDCDANLDNAMAFRSADVRFHRVLAEIPGNPIFVALHEAFVERLMKERRLPDDARDHLSRSNDEHKAIVKAILEKDADLAVDVLTGHLVRTYASYFDLKLVRGNQEEPQRLASLPNT